MCDRIFTKLDPASRETMTSKNGIVAILFLMGSTPLAAQTDPIEAWVAFQNQNAKLASIVPGSVIKYDFRWSRRGVCALRVEEQVTSGSSISKSLRDIQLGTLDPIGRVSSSLSPDLPATLAFEVPTGAKAIHIEAGKSKFSLSIWVILEPSSPVADSAKRLGELAIKACGGRESIPTERAAQDARQKATQAQANALLGTTLDPTLKQLLIRRCQDEVKSQLKAPSTAVFDSTVSVMKIPTSGNYTVLGSVEAQNALGGRLSKPYLCEMEKYGEQWVSKSVTIR